MSENKQKNLNFKEKSKIVAYGKVNRNSFTTYVRNRRMGKQRIQNVEKTLTRPSSVSVRLSAQSRTCLLYGRWIYTDKNDIVHPMKVLQETLVLLYDDGHCALERIVGGRQASEQEFPYQLSLMYNGHLICGATLISQDTALTAAHCLPKHGVYSVRAGSIYMDKDGVVLDVREAIIHPAYDSNTEDFDLAILKLSEPLPLSEKIKPIRLPDQDEFPPKDVKGHVTGWGSVSSFENFFPEQLKVLEMPILEKGTCEAIYNSINKITKRMFCAGYRQGGRDSCQGDSGGPFVFNGTLYGLVSWGFNCGEPGYPGVYTNVSSLRSYIKLNAHV